MRLFTAITLPDDVKKSLSIPSAKIREYVQSGNFSDWRNYHITLVFLGETDKDDLPIIKEIIDDAAAHTPPLYLRCRETGYFSRKNRKILYYNVGGAVELLAKLQLYLYNRFGKNGFCKPQGGYTPHITFARQVKMNEIPEITQDLAFASGAVTLMHSTRIDGQLTYLPIYESPFTGTFTVDRIEEGIAVCETSDRQFVNIPAEHLPNEVKSDSIVRYSGLNYALDVTATKDRTDAITRKFNKEKRKPY